MANLGEVVIGDMHFPVTYDPDTGHIESYCASDGHRDPRGKVVTLQFAWPPSTRALTVFNHLRDHVTIRHGASTWGGDHA